MVNRDKYCFVCKKQIVKKSKESYEQFNSRKYCSNTCSAIERAKTFIGREPWNKGKKTGIVPWNCFKKGDPRISGENHKDWKGDNVSYGGIHKWIAKKLGKPMMCQLCLTNTKRMYHWANISGEYNRDISDWIRLCVPCHKKYDKNKK